MDHYTHKMRFSDSSMYDYVCSYCGRVDDDIKLRKPCDYTNTRWITARIKMLMDKIVDSK